MYFSPGIGIPTFSRLGQQSSPPDPALNWLLEPNFTEVNILQYPLDTGGDITVLAVDQSSVQVAVE